MATYIHELPQWPQFTWQADTCVDVLAEVRYLQGKLLGKMEALGFGMREEANLTTLTIDVVKSSEIEGKCWICNR